MTNKEVIERLKQGNWYVHCQTKRESDLILQSCDEAGLEWSGGQKATEFTPYNHYPLDIGFRGEEFGITHGTKYYKESGHENITDWFFNAIKNNDDNGKLTPQNAEQERLVQILLAMKQVFYVEVDYGVGWTKATILLHDGDFKYRINPKPDPDPDSTPLPTSREMWGFIDKKWRFMAMDRSKIIYLYEEKPTASDDFWLHEDGSYSQCPLNINTDGINWETSLTERPEDV